MKKAIIWLIILILALNGCNKEDIIATTAKEFNVELVSTNVTDSTPYFVNDGQYDGGEIVKIGDEIHVVNTPSYDAYDEHGEYKKGDYVTYNQKIFRANIDLSIYPDKYNTSADTLALYKPETFYPERVGESMKTLDVLCDAPSVITLNITTIGILKKSFTIHKDYLTNPGSCIDKDDSITLIEWTSSSMTAGDRFSHEDRLYQKGSTGVNIIVNPEATSGTGYVVVPGGGRPWEQVDHDTTYIRPVNQLLPFDDMNTSYATATNTMTYTIKALQSFNSFTLAGVTADSLTYTIKDSLAVVVKTDTIVLDCDLDDDGLLPQGEITKLISAGETVEEDGTIEISLTSTGEVKLGTFMTNIAIDEGATEMLIKAGFRDTNSYAEDPWGNIEEGVKPITRKFDITVMVEYAKFDKTYRRHKSFLGKFITLDGTDATLTENGLTLHSLVARGLIISVGHETLTKDNDMKPYYKYNMSFLEIV